ncbi:uncharacterized protein LOC143225301 [Tachypleus tridentatus]|uniref:uncharacterized protein LOC143225301 n=1 Tax=Tachypleus tridentatus TaxID=6853 RepID=UPI003FD6453E
MKALFVTLVVLVTLTLTKGNMIDVGSQIICKMNKDKPDKVNAMRKCMESVFKEKSDWLADAIRECEFSKFPHKNYHAHLNEMCKKERKADVQDIKNCIAEKFAAIHEDPENVLAKLIDKCF